MLKALFMLFETEKPLLFIFIIGKFLGDLRATNFQFVTFHTFISDDKVNEKVKVHNVAVNEIKWQMTGSKGETRTIWSDSSLPGQQKTIPLHEEPAFLVNVSEFKICLDADFPALVPYWWWLSHFSIDSAELSSSSGDPSVTWIESCECPEGYSGDSCESCAPGYYRKEGGGPYGKCIPFREYSSSFETNCSVSCGEGVKAKITMTCKKECFPDCCRREVIESPCKIEECKNSFDPWSDWSECTKPCISNIEERSIKKRSRVCRDCTGNDNGMLTFHAS